MNRVVCLCSDLIFATRITSTAQAVGCPLLLVRDPARLKEALTPSVSTVILDAAAERCDIVDVVQQVRERQDPPTIIAYISHVETQLAEHIRSAGADQVLPRSAFSTRLPENPARV